MNTDRFGGGAPNPDGGAPLNSLQRGGSGAPDDGGAEPDSFSAPAGQCYSPPMFAWIPGGKSGRVIAIAVAAGLATGLLLVPLGKSPNDPKEPLPPLALLRQQ